MRFLESFLFTLVCVGCGGVVERPSASGTGGGANDDAGGAGGSDGGAGSSGTGGTMAMGQPAGSGGKGGNDFDAGSSEARSRACDHWFAAQQACAIAPPPDATARLAAQFKASCVAAFGQKGAAHTAADVEACAAALDAAQCGSPDGPPLACDLRGSLPAGAPCILGTQCQSGSCSGTDPGVTPGGRLPGAVTCGTCSALAALGESCNGPCPQGAACITADTTATTAQYKCVPVVEGDVGQRCDHVTALCKPGLYCNDQSKQCVPLGHLGEACVGPGTTGCVTPLFCAGKPSTCQAPQPPGASCDDPAVWDRGCAAGGACSAGGVCEPVTWAEPGEPCDGVLVRCRVTTCPPGPITGGNVTSTCPVVVEDEAPCTVNDTCDTYSECVNSVAKRTANPMSGVCMPRSSAVCG